MISIYCDGSATIASKPGGYGVVIVLDGVELHRHSGSMEKATNNEAEISAAIYGLDWYINAKAAGMPELVAVSTVELVSDSQLVLRYASGEYKCKAMHLLPLYLKLRKLYGDSKAVTRWVKGHNNDYYNEICDKLAKHGRVAAESQQAQRNACDVEEKEI